MRWVLCVCVLLISQTVVPGQSLTHIRKGAICSLLRICFRSTQTECRRCFWKAQWTWFLFTIKQTALVGVCVSIVACYIKALERSVFTDRRLLATSQDTDACVSYIWTGFHSFSQSVHQSHVWRELPSQSPLIPQPDSHDSQSHSWLGWHSKGNRRMETIALSGAETRRL